MAKDKLWFTHDLNARNDRKIAPLVNCYKSAGYGIFWCAVEMMHEEGGFLEFDEITFSAIAKDLNEDIHLVEEVINRCIVGFKLFTIENNRLISNRVSDNISDMEESRKNKSKAGKASAERRKNRTGVQQVFNDCLTSDEQNPTQTNKQTNSTLSSSLDSIEVFRYLENTESLKELESDEEKKETCMLIQEMFSIYLNKRPDYQPCKEVDYPALLQMAYRLADYGKWKKAEILSEKKAILLKTWGIVLDYLFSKDWAMKDKTLHDLAYYKENFQRILTDLIERRKRQDTEAEKLVGPKIVSTYKNNFPHYLVDTKEDNFRGFQIALHIAAVNEWPRESVGNGKMQPILDEWGALVEFMRTDHWYAKKTFPEFSSLDFFKKLYQAFKNPNNGTKTSQRSNAGSHRKSEFRPGRDVPDVSNF